MHYRRDPARYKARAAANNKLIRAQNRERLLEILNSAQCMDCGVRDVVVLEFDHREPQEKRYDVSHLVLRAYSWTMVSSEIAKCDVVCANCHRKRTARQFRWHKFKPADPRLPPLPKRGTPHYERIRNRRRDLVRRHRNKVRLSAFLREHPCVQCGEDDPVLLDFDHFGLKLGNVGDMINRGSWSNVQAEIEKCRVLCANCHRRHTAQQAGRLR